MPHNSTRSAPLRCASRRAASAELSVALSGARDDSTQRSVAACAAAMSVAPPASPTLFSHRLSARTAGRFLVDVGGGVGDREDGEHFCAALSQVTS